MEHAAFSPATPFPAGLMNMDRGLPRAALSLAGGLDMEARASFGSRSMQTLVQAVLDHVHFGVAVVDPQLQVVFANRAAQRECARHPIVRMDRGQIVILQSQCRSDFMQALSQARMGRWSLLKLEHADERMMLAVVPLSHPSTGTDPLALVVFGLRSACKSLAIQFYAQSCGLTPAETRVLGALSEGLSPREIAQQHQVELSTVRTQVRCIRDKTGARSITDLVRTLSGLPPIMPAALSVV